MRSNDYHWAEIDHPMPANISEEDQDDTTKEREGVFGGGCIFWEENILRKHLENKELKKITRVRRYH